MMRALAHSSCLDPAGFPAPGTKTTDPLGGLHVGIETDDFAQLQNLYAMILPSCPAESGSRFELASWPRAGRSWEGWGLENGPRGHGESPLGEWCEAATVLCGDRQLGAMAVRAQVLGMLRMLPKQGALARGQKLQRPWLLESLASPWQA